MEKPLVNVMYNGEVGAKHQILTYKILRKNRFCTTYNKLIKW